MNKPDTKAIRARSYAPLQIDNELYALDMMYRTSCDIKELCDYIDSLNEYGNPIDNARRLAWYLTLRTKIQDCPPENSPITGHFWRKNGVTCASEITEMVNLHAEKAAADAKAQIREFVEAERRKLLESGWLANQYGPLYLQSVLDFIDNDPKKPTAEEIVEKCIENAYPYRLGLREDVVRSLREAGLLKEGK